MPGPPIPDRINFGDLKPISKCVDFQSEKVGDRGTTCLVDGFKFNSLTGQSLQVIEEPKPDNAHEWVPDKVKFLHMEPQGPWMRITLPATARWAEVSLAFKPQVRSQASMTAIAESVNNTQSAQYSKVAGVVRSFAFTRSELVIPGYDREFDTPPPPEELGPIKSLLLYTGTGLFLWRVCYF